MIQFEPVITIGQMLVLGIVLLLFVFLHIRSSKNVRRLDKSEAKMEAMQEQMRSLMQSFARTPPHDG